VDGILAKNRKRHKAAELGLYLRDVCCGIVRLPISYNEFAREEIGSLSMWNGKHP